jgi:Outer membrane receptor for Fe3+-dicitrate
MRHILLIAFASACLFGGAGAQTDSTKNAVLRELTISAGQEQTMGLGRLKSVEGVVVYEGKKSEVVSLRDITANLATNNPRQVFSRVAGLNIWESDGAGLQLGIGGRGLSPNRTSNFNTRQNGYDISADALGYPESYYTPPLKVCSASKWCAARPRCNMALSSAGCSIS